MKLLVEIWPLSDLAEQERSHLVAGRRVKLIAVAGLSVRR